MPRRPRMYLPGFTYHIVQRGNNRQPCFFDRRDYETYLALLSQSLGRYEAQLHAYVLMTNHVHLLMTPLAHDSISRVMKVVASRYAHAFNKRHGRSGTVWEGRHKASLIQAEKYLLACYRYIELNPVSARMTDSAAQYPWSSHGTTAWGEHCEWITPHPVYLALGGTLERRLLQYRQLFESLGDGESAAIRKAIHYCQPLADDEFRSLIESRLQRPLGQAGRGRPAARNKAAGTIKGAGGIIF